MMQCSVDGRRGEQCERKNEGTSGSASEVVPGMTGAPFINVSIEIFNAFKRMLHPIVLNQAYLRLAGVPLSEILTGRFVCALSCK